MRTVRARGRIGGLDSTAQSTAKSKRTKPRRPNSFEPFAANARETVLNVAELLKNERAQLYRSDLFSAAHTDIGRVHQGYYEATGGACALGIVLLASLVKHRKILYAQMRYHSRRRRRPALTPHGEAAGSKPPPAFHDRQKNSPLSSVQGFFA
ncbi:hypothetical protein PQR08_06990 [Caballeronia jiangsuensis]|uniref:Uncharacterized protein n=1 Tax=Caballeronia jiangsuensis TaxID=1458357 RepID=A0ABW9CH06_9BURK